MAFLSQIIFWIYSLIRQVEDKFSSSETTVGVPQIGFVERLRLVEPVTVCCPALVSMQVLFSPPLCSVPKLGVGAVTAGQFVRSLVFELESGTCIESHSGVSAAPVGPG